MKDWEEQNRMLRVEKEKAMQKRKQETERRLRELQDMVEEKRKEREEKLEMLRNRKVLNSGLRWVNCGIDIVNRLPLWRPSSRIWIDPSKTTWLHTLQQVIESCGVSGLILSR